MSVNFKITDLVEAIEVVRSRLRFPLINAIETGNIEGALAMIMNQRCNINERGPHNITALLLCCFHMVRHPENKHKCLDLLHALVENDAYDINACESLGGSVLIYACLYGVTDFIDSLLAHPHCSLTLRDPNGETALH